LVLLSMEPDAVRRKISRSKPDRVFRQSLRKGPKLSALGVVETRQAVKRGSRGYSCFLVGLAAPATSAEARLRPSPNFSQPSGCNHVSHAISLTCLDCRLRRISIRLHPAHCDKSRICHNLRDFATKFVRNPGYNQAQIRRKKSQHKFLTYRPNCINLRSLSICVNCMNSGFENCLEIFCG